MSEAGTDQPDSLEAHDRSRIQEWQSGAALALLGSLLAVIGIVVVSYQNWEEFPVIGGCFDGACPYLGPRFFPAAPPTVLSIWGALSLGPLLSLIARRGFLIGIIASAALAGVTADWAFWVEQGINPTNPVALFQGTIAVCIGASLGFAGYWTLRRARRNQAEVRAVATSNESRVAARPSSRDRAADYMTARSSRGRGTSTSGHRR
jgi:hypothetical protein